MYLDNTLTSTARAGHFRPVMFSQISLQFEPCWDKKQVFIVCSQRDVQLSPVALTCASLNWIFSPIQTFFCRDGQSVAMLKLLNVKPDQETRVHSAEWAEPLLRAQVSSAPGSDLKRRDFNFWVSYSLEVGLAAV